MVGDVERGVGVGELLQVGKCHLARLALDGHRRAGRDLRARWPRVRLRRAHDDVGRVMSPGMPGDFRLGQLADGKLEEGKDSARERPQEVRLVLVVVDRAPEGGPPIGRLAAPRVVARRHRLALVQMPCPTEQRAELHVRVAVDARTRRPAIEVGVELFRRERSGQNLYVPGREGSVGGGVHGAWRPGAAPGRRTDPRAAARLCAMATPGGGCGIPVQNTTAGGRRHVPQRRLIPPEPRAPRRPGPPTTMRSGRGPHGERAAPAAPPARRDRPAPAAAPRGCGG